MKNKMSKLILFLILILLTSGCVKQYYNEEIISVIALPADDFPRTDNKVILMITTNIRNNMYINTTNNLTLKIIVSDNSIQARLLELVGYRRNIAELETPPFYIENRSTISNYVSVDVPAPGEYMINAQIFDSGFLIHQNSTTVKVRKYE